MHGRLVLYCSAAVYHAAVDARLPKSAPDAANVGRFCLVLLHDRHILPIKLTDDSRSGDLVCFHNYLRCDLDYPRPFECVDVAIHKYSFRRYIFIPSYVGRQLHRLLMYGSFDSIYR